jgi:hypothetical protein
MLPARTVVLVRAAEMAGDRERARGYCGQLIELIVTVDTTRPEVTMARTFMAAPG